MSHLSLLCPIMSHIWTILLKLNINEIFGIGLSCAVADIVCEQLLMLVELILAMMMIIFIGAFYTRVGWWPTSAVDGRSELYVDAPSWLVLDRHQPKEYLIQRVTIFWGGWIKYFHQIWMQSCDRFLPCVAKLNQCSIIPLFHQRLMECFEIWVKPVKLFSITSQNSGFAFFHDFIYLNCPKLAGTATGRLVLT